MLARFGALLEPAVRRMHELHAARNVLVRDRIAAQNRQKNLVLALLERQAARRLAQIEDQLAAIDAQRARLVETDPDLQARFNSLVSIPGIGNTTALALLIERPELGTLEHRQAASLAGLSPDTRESGQCKGKYFISGGRATLRQASTHRHPLRCRPQSQIPSHDRRRNAEGRHHRRHAKARRPRQRVAQEPSAMDS